MLTPTEQLQADVTPEIWNRFAAAFAAQREEVATAQAAIFQPQIDAANAQLSQARANAEASLKLANDKASADLAAANTNFQQRVQQWDASLKSLAQQLQSEKEQTAALTAKIQAIYAAQSDLVIAAKNGDEQIRNGLALVEQGRALHAAVLDAAGKTLEQRQAEALAANIAAQQAQLAKLQPTPPAP